MHVCALCVYVHECVCVCVQCIARTQGYIGAVENYTQSNKTLQRPSLTTISSDRVAMIFTARYARLPTHTCMPFSRVHVSVLVVHTLQSLYPCQNCTSSKKERFQCYTHKHSHSLTHTNTHTHTHTHTNTQKFQCYLGLVVLVRMTVMIATHMTKCKSPWNSQVCNMFGMGTAPDPKIYI